MSKRARDDVDFPLRGPLVGVQWGAWIAVVLVLAGAVASIWLPEDVWKPLAAWFGTGGTLLAVAVAASAARHEAAAAARRARDEQVEKEIQQARLVTVEVHPSGVEDPQYSDDYDASVTITNHSGDLILEPRLLGFTHPRNGGETSWDIADIPEYGEYPGPPTILKPGASEGLLVRIIYRPELHPGTNGRSEAVIAFTDAAGRRWRRVGSERPVQVRVDIASSRASEAAIVERRADGPEWYRIDP